MPRDTAAASAAITAAVTNDHHYFRLLFFDFGEDSSRPDPLLALSSLGEAPLLLAWLAFPSLPFLTCTLAPWDLRLRVRSELALMPGKSLALKTSKMSLSIVAMVGILPPVTSESTFTLTSVKRSRYRPFCRHDRSWKTKKHPRRSLSFADAGTSGSFPMNGFATKVPISRRDCLSVLFGSGMVETSRLAAPVSVGRVGTEWRAQWTMFMGQRSRA